MYRLVAIFAALILFAHLWAQYGRAFETFGLRWSLATVVLCLLLPLRDMIQNVGGRKAVLVTIGITAVLGYFIRHEGLQAGAVAVSLLWMEILDFGVWTYFKKFGWAVGMIVSDVLSAPLLPLMYVWLVGLPAHLVFDGLTVRFIILSFVYFFFLVVREPHSFSNLPKFAIRQRG